MILAATGLDIPEIASRTPIFRSAPPSPLFREPRRPALRARRPQDRPFRRLSKIVKTMRGQARLTEENTKDMLREVRIALLEADVALPVVREVLARIKEKAMGEEVVGNLNPGQALVGVVQRELTAIIGGDVPAAERDINLHTQPPAVILLAGLQGAGKTTSAGKLAKYLIETKRKKVLTVSADVYRPAAIEQLKTVTEQAGAEWFPSTVGQKPLEIAAAAIDHARRKFFDVLIVDTAGRLAIDEAMMQEVAELNTFLKPVETLFVIDAMLGQDAVNTAKAFNERLPLTGVVLTKIDGDSRGGAALSVLAVTGMPIYFQGTGEKLEDLEPFYPARMANRILGMGDVLSLIEKAQSVQNDKEAEAAAKRLMENKFDMNDLLAQFQQIKKMGGAASLLAMMPGGSQIDADSLDDKALPRIEAIIYSMTPAERAKPDIINPKRKRRIAAGSGTRVEDVNKLLKQYEMMQKMMKQFKKSPKGFARRLGGMMGNPNAFRGLK